MDCNSDASTIVDRLTEPAASHWADGADAAALTLLTRVWRVARRDAEHRPAPRGAPQYGHAKKCSIPKDIPTYFDDYRVGSMLPGAHFQAE
jgi:hypothetical protein